MRNGERSTTKVSLSFLVRNVLIGLIQIQIQTQTFVPSVERRRRDKINNWIVQLSKAIPDCNIDYTKTGQVSPDPGLSAD